MANALPIHPRTGLSAVGLVNGRPVWRILGAEDNPANPVQPPPAPVAPAQPAADAGFPANTPIDQMTAEQQVAYWRHYARRHESRANAFGDLTPEQATQIRKELADLKSANATDTEKREMAAREAAKAEASAEYLPMLAQARIEGAAAGRVSPDALTKALEFTDLSKFVTNGQVDTAKVSAFVESIAPAKGTATPAPRGPIVAPHNPGGPAPVKPGEPARAWLARRGIKVD